MARAQVSYSCRECGASSLKWQGQCPACGAWNALAEQGKAPATRRGGYAGELEGRRLDDVGADAAARSATGIGELDRVLGGGLVAGSVVLLGGDPGIGKSTLLLQAAALVNGDGGALYVSGEESMAQIAQRATRLGLDTAGITVLAATCVEDIVQAAGAAQPSCLVIDSIQTMYTAEASAAPGSPSQLRDCTAQLVRFAKTSGVAVILVGHVTKEGQIAGPRMLEHMVDVVLYFENDAGSRYRILRAVKNRFGAANELGIFALTEAGIREVRNPSAIFLGQHQKAVAGSVVTVTHQGSRPLLVEVQALTDRAGGGSPRRVAVGMEQNRLVLLLAALHRHLGVAVHDEDVFVNVVGGIRIGETAADLAAAWAVVSSISARPVSRRTVVFGELGLTGEIRPVAYGQERLAEAAKLGFTRAVVPAGNLPRKKLSDIEVTGVADLDEALAPLRD